MKILWLIIALGCGALLPVQAGLNSRLGKSLDSPLFASMFTFVVGAVSLAVCLPFARESFTWKAARAASVSEWIGGGLTGAIFITLTMLALSRLGMALTFGLVVAGQMVVAVLLDHFGVLIELAHPFNGWRFLGIVLIISGVVLVRRF
ncbi:MAG TPA: DMT family transporter [Puia sp.]|uniref:DMT family transporter n=1 Tax=Puia sp. TaxID=2045100 RepID=UPI002CC0904F|nr:DMT family transporter [Puia sp.]HVU94486.1 DMT family transporter [Puia sp.]